MPDYLQVFEQYRRDLLGALRQITDDEFKVSPGGTANSAAVIIQHLSGNLASRFTDFLTSDGEKPWREREAEFQASERSRQGLVEEFGRAWAIMRRAVAGLTDEEMCAPITVRGEPRRVEEAVVRSVERREG